MIGAWGSILVFEVSSSKMLTPGEVEVSGSARYASQELLGQLPVLEFIGPGLATCSMSVRLAAAQGVAPRAQLDKLRAAMQSGQVATLVLGGKPIFDAGHQAVLESMSESWEFFTGSGGLMQAEGKLTFREIGDRGAAVMTSTSSSTTVKKNNVSKSGGW